MSATAKILVSPNTAPQIAATTTLEIPAPPFCPTRPDEGLPDLGALSQYLAGSLWAHLYRNSTGARLFRAPWVDSRFTPPRFHLLIGIGQGREPKGVWVLVPLAAAEGHDARLVGRFARSLEPYHDLASVGPQIRQEGLEFGAIVAISAARVAAFGSHPA